jgi:hypothetical protein
MPRASATIQGGIVPDGGVSEKDTTFLSAAKGASLGASLGGSNGLSRARRSATLSAVGSSPGEKLGHCMRHFGWDPPTRELSRVLILRR